MRKRILATSATKQAEQALAKGRKGNFIWLKPYDFGTQNARG